MSTSSCSARDVRTVSQPQRCGFVYSGGKAWTGTHELWLAGQHFDAPARQLTYASSLEAMHEILDRRDRLDEAISRP